MKAFSSSDLIQSDRSGKCLCSEFFSDPNISAFVDILNISSLLSFCPFGVFGCCNQKSCYLFGCPEKLVD